MTDLRAWARALGGGVEGGQVNCPGPGHSRTDRSLSVRPSATSPLGFITHSFAGDDVKACLDHVAAALGVERHDRRQDRHQPRQARSTPKPARREDGADKIADIRRALAIFDAAGPAEGSAIGPYLRARLIEPPADCHDWLRFHPRCPFGPGGQTEACMVALFRDIRTDEPCGIQRSAIPILPDLWTPGLKVDRKMMGRMKGAAIKIDEDADVYSACTWPRALSPRSPHVKRGFGRPGHADRRARSAASTSCPSSNI
jgi:putative DNA primase/helicase